MILKPVDYIHSCLTDISTDVGLFEELDLMIFTGKCQIIHNQLLSFMSFPTFKRFGSIQKRELGTSNKIKGCLQDEF